MSVEKEIMCAVVRMDMFLVSAWKCMLALIVALGILALITLRNSQ